MEVSLVASSVSTRVSSTGGGGGGGGDLPPQTNQLSLPPKATPFGDHRLIVTCSIKGSKFGIFQSSKLFWLRVLRGRGHIPLLHSPPRCGLRPCNW